MGFVNLTVRIANLVDHTRAEEIEMLADSGALYSVVPAEVLDRIGVRSTHVEEFELADGRVIERRLGVAHVTVRNRQAAANVIFGDPGDSTLLGVVTLEELGLVIDPSTGDLKPIQFRLGRLSAPPTSFLEIVAISQNKCFWQISDHARRRAENKGWTALDDI